MSFSGTTARAYMPIAGQWVPAPPDWVPPLGMFSREWENYRERANARALAAAAAGLSPADVAATGADVYLRYIFESGVSALREAVQHADADQARGETLATVLSRSYSLAMYDGVPQTGAWFDATYQALRGALESIVPGIAAPADALVAAMHAELAAGFARGRAQLAVAAAPDDAETPSAVVAQAVARVMAEHVGIEGGHAFTPDQLADARAVVAGTVEAAKTLVAPPVPAAIDAALSTTGTTVTAEKGRGGLLLLGGVLGGLYLLGRRR